MERALHEAGAARDAGEVPIGAVGSPVGVDRPPGAGLAADAFVEAFCAGPGEVEERADGDHRGGGEQ